jgi:hypothetical protein
VISTSPDLLDSSDGFELIPIVFLSAAARSRQNAGWLFESQTGKGDNHQNQQTLRIRKFFHIDI